MVDSESEHISVGVADYAVTTDGRPLKTSGVGSCVAVAIHDADAAVGGLLHFMLPKSNTRSETAPNAKFADTGLETMITAFERRGGVPSRSWAALVGGATMLELGGCGQSIGDRNVAAARRLLEAADISVRASKVGGSIGRTIIFDPQTGDVAVRSADGTVVLE